MANALLKRKCEIEMQNSEKKPPYIVRTFANIFDVSEQFKNEIILL